MNLKKDRDDKGLNDRSFSLSEPSNRASRALLEGALYLLFGISGITIVRKVLQLESPLPLCTSDGPLVRPMRQ